MSSTQRNRAFLSLFQPGASHRDAALAYASYRMFVHPLRTGSKEPRLRAWQDKATIKSDVIRKWWPEGSKDNIGIFLPKSCVVVIDVDPRNGGDETFEALIQRHGYLPATYTVKTAGDGRHYYFRVPADFYYSNNTYPSTLGDGVDLLVNKYVVAPPSELDDGRQYTVSTGDVEQDFTPLPFDWLDEVVRARIIERKETWYAADDWSFGQGERNDGATKIAGYLRRIGASAQEIEDCLHAFGSRFENYTEDVEFRKTEIPRIADSIGNHRPAEVRLNDISLQIRQKSYRPTIDIEGPAFQGPIGEFVKYIEPITEAHPAAILGQALTMFGNIIGARDIDDPGPGYRVEGGHQKTNLYLMLVGESAHAGKGDSLSRVKHFLKHLDPAWKIISGIQSGEALISANVDEEEQETTAIIQGTPTKLMKKGAVDKRCMVVESEFSRVIHVASRQGSTITDTMRSMWDEGEGQTNAKASQQKASNVTLSIIGHTTNTDLSRGMSDDDLRNGFGARFLYVHAERTQRLPSAPDIPNDDLIELLAPMHAALEFAQTEAPTDYGFSPEAWHLWKQIVDLGDKRVEKLGDTVENTLQGRDRPQMRRMAVIYAVADCSDVIEVQHLRAAQAFWDYCFDSAMYIFGNRIGDPMADKLYRALIEYAPGLTTTEINKKVFGGNKSKAQITRALDILMDRGIITRIQIKQGRKTVALYQIPQHQPYEGEK